MDRCSGCGWLGSGLVCPRCGAPTALEKRPEPPFIPAPPGPSGLETLSPEGQHRVALGAKVAVGLGTIAVAGLALWLWLPGYLQEIQTNDRAYLPTPSTSAEGSREERQKRKAEQRERERCQCPDGARHAPGCKLDQARAELKASGCEQVCELKPSADPQDECFWQGSGAS